jgi:oligoendopeptidase F
VLEQALQDATQVIVDILSRFRFETMLFDRRTKGALGEKKLHPYMWAVKGHYYNHDRPFYNFPYAFGQLFGLALYAEYEAGSPNFADRYRDLLARTGHASAVEVTREVGFDIESPEFWPGGIELITRRVERFETPAQHGG